MKLFAWILTILSFCVGSLGFVEKTFGLNWTLKENILLFALFFLVTVWQVIVSRRKDQELNRKMEKNLDEAKRYGFFMSS